MPESRSWKYETQNFLKVVILLTSDHFVLLSFRICSFESMDSHDLQKPPNYFQIQVFSKISETYLITFIDVAKKSFPNIDIRNICGIGKTVESESLKVTFELNHTFDELLANTKTYFFKRTDQDTTRGKFVVTWYGAVKIKCSFRIETAFLLAMIIAHLQRFIILPNNRTQSLNLMGHLKLELISIFKFIEWFCPFKNDLISNLVIDLILKQNM